MIMVCSRRARGAEPEVPIEGLLEECTPRRYHTAPALKALQIYVFG
jgi:hypothetical protein